MRRFNVVSIPEPCDASWDDEMDGDDQVRVCRGCDTPVHDLDAMDPADAEALLATEGPLCIRKQFLGDVPRPSRRAALVAIAAGVAAIGCGPKKVRITLEPWDGTQDSADRRAAQARALLREMDWTDAQIDSEARWWRHREKHDLLEAPANAEEEELNRLLEAVAATLPVTGDDVFDVSPPENPMLPSGVVGRFGP